MARVIPLGILPRDFSSSINVHRVMCMYILLVEITTVAAISCVHRLGEVADEG